MNKQLLIIGKPHSSKSVFIAQFYSRLQKQKSTLSLYKPVDDLSSISSTREALANGDEPGPTAPEKTINIALPVQFKGEKLDLLCPDYGGEQINRILSTREVNEQWEKAIINSNNWIFFIRLNSIRKYLDLSKITVTPEYTENNNQKAEDAYVISDQSSLIELLQIILEVKGHDYHFKNASVKLTVVMTCWDELETEESPSDILKKTLPLFEDFIRANWNHAFVKIIGLAALGVPLDKSENKEKYQIEGPENFGFLVKESGEKTNDITELITEAL